MAARIGEVKPASAGKAEDRFHDRPSRLLHPALHSFQIGRIDDYKRATGPYRRCRLEATAQPAVGEAGVLALVPEGFARPSEKLA